MVSALDQQIAIWVIDDSASSGCLERLGDARRIGTTMDSRVGVLIVGCGAIDPSILISHGADLVLHSSPAESVSLAGKVATTLQALDAFRPRVVFAGGEPSAREWAALLAAGNEWDYISPALLVQWQNEQLEITQLDHSGRQSRRIPVDPSRAAVITMRSGVAEAMPPDPDRDGHVRAVERVPADRSILESRVVPADPAEVDICFADRLVAGGRGVGSREGFGLLRSFAEQLDAGVAASRMAVDLGWIDYERQVGQTGRTVEPKLYIACGISGASHHLEGMSKSGHIVAINSDPDAPIFQAAHLGLIADLHEVLGRAQRRLQS